MTKEIKNFQGKTITCLECDNPIKCKCLEFDTDYGVYYFCSLDCYNKFNAKGNYNFDCEFGRHFKEKWKEAMKMHDSFRDLYYKFHAEWKKLKYPKEKSGATLPPSLHSGN